LVARRYRRRRRRKRRMSVEHERREANPNEVGPIQKEEGEVVVVVEDFIWIPKGVRRMLTRWDQTGLRLNHDSMALLWHPPYDTPPP
jgi:hypothetical protein